MVVAPRVWVARRAPSRGLKGNPWPSNHLAPLQNAVYFEPRARVAPIAAFLSRSKATAILVLDKQRDRLITMTAGEVREWSNLEDFVPQRSDQSGWSQMRYERHSDHWRKHHVDHAADLTLKLLQHHPFDWLILGDEVQTESELEQDLHPYLRDRVIGHIHIRVDAELSEIVRRARELQDRVEAGHIAVVWSCPSRQPRVRPATARRNRWTMSSTR
jgi:hypothetical protein